MVGMFPLFALTAQRSSDDTMLLLALYTVGGIVGPPLLGVLADRFERHNVLMLAGAATLVGGASLQLTIGDAWLSALSVLVLGIGATSMYSLGLALLGRHFVGADLAAINAVMIFMFSAGSTLGPAAAGGAMQGLGPVGFPVIIVGITAIFLALAVSRRLALGTARAT
jgi:MFS family permease